MRCSHIEKTALYKYRGRIEEHCIYCINELAEEIAKLHGIDKHRAFEILADLPSAK